MTSIIEKLNAVGYWRVVVRAAKYSPERFESLAEVRRAMELSKVRFRGWEFPPFPRNDAPPPAHDRIYVEIDQGQHVEAWQAHKSGQFIYRGGIPSDWYHQHPFALRASAATPGDRLPIVSSLWSVTEFFEFASRFSQTKAGDEEMYVCISIHGLAGRRLVGDTDRHAWDDPSEQAKAKEWPLFDKAMSRADLIANSRAYAVAATQSLFHAFQSEFADEILRALQSELFAPR